MHFRYFKSQLSPNNNYMNDNIEYQQKWKNVTEHIKNQQNIPQNVFKDPSLNKEMQSRKIIIRNQQIYQEVEQYITFYDFNYKSLTLDCKDKNFPVTIKIASNNIQCVIYTSYTCEKPSKANYSQKYFVKGRKLIVIESQISHENLYVAIQIKQQDKGLLSQISILIFFASMKRSKTSEKNMRNFRSKSYKQQERKKLDQYITKNLDLAKEILKQKKNQHKINFIELNKNSIDKPRRAMTAQSSRKESAEKINQTKEKFNCILFQNQKSKYINHLSKMNLTIPLKLKTSRSKFIDEKSSNIKFSCMLVKFYSFFKFLSIKQHQYHDQFIRETRVNNICKRFVMKLKNRIRKKMLFLNKIRLGFRQSLWISCKIMSSSIDKKANNLILSLLDTIKYNAIKEKIQSQSKKYINKIQKIQKFWKGLFHSRFNLFEQMILRQIQNHHRNEIQKKLNAKNKKHKLFIKYINKIIKKYNKNLKLYENNKILKKPRFAFFNNIAIIKDIIAVDLKIQK